MLQLKRRRAEVFSMYHIAAMLFFNSVSYGYFFDTKLLCHHLFLGEDEREKSADARNRKKKCGDGWCAGIMVPCCSTCHPHYQIGRLILTVRFPCPKEIKIKHLSRQLLQLMAQVKLNIGAIRNLFRLVATMYYEHKYYCNNFSKTTFETIVITVALLLPFLVFQTLFCTCFFPVHKQFGETFFARTTSHFLFRKIKTRCHIK